MIDLHLHSTASDGTLSPSELVATAASLGLSAIALTDHDSVSGVRAAQAASAGRGITVVSGVELSADVPGGDCHVLGYFVDVDHKPFATWLAERRDTRVARGEEIVRRVNAELVRRHGSAAPQASWARVAKRSDLAGGGSVGRPHVADELVAIGAVASRDEAFRTLLGTGMAGDVPAAKVSPAGVISVIRDAGGVAVLAHPTYLPDFTVRLPEFVACGLGGLECLYGEYAPEVVAELVGIARAHGLVVTGGSDFHGPSLNAGSGAIGVPDVPDAVLEELSQRRARG
jgi:predicted metal-dependent phosphoesterase TrpH